MKIIKKIAKQKKPFYINEKDTEKFVQKYTEKYNSLYYVKKVEEINKLLPSELKGKYILDAGCA